MMYVTRARAACIKLYDIGDHCSKEERIIRWRIRLKAVFSKATVLPNVLAAGI